MATIFWRTVDVNCRTQSAVRSRSNDISYPVFLLLPGDAVDDFILPQVLGILGLHSGTMNRRRVPDNDPLADEAIGRTLEPFGVEVSLDLAGKIREYIELLLLWNRRINLTSIIEPSAILERHFGESFLAVKTVPISDGRLVDIGSGAGFPALPIKLALPSLKVTLAEANMKKVAFLLEVLRRLNLEGVDVHRSRFEEFPLPDGFADYVTSRAVGEYTKLLCWATRVVKPGGRTVLWIGEKDRERITRIAGWKVNASVPSPHSRERVLLVLQKAAGLQS